MTTNTLHIYTRVSSLIQQEDGTSLESQKQLGIKKAAELKVEFRLWNEGGQSSFHDDLNNRPVLVSLLTLIASGEVKHLFVYNADRLSRNQQTWAVIRYKLLAHGVTLHTASGQMQLKNPVDDLMLGILSEISQYDNRIRSERSRIGRFHKVQQGNWKGGPPPFGYHLTKRRLEVDPFESLWVKQIYDWYCGGTPLKEIQHRLSRQGITTRRGNAQWSLGSLQLILRNPVYSGYFDYTDKMVGETVRIQTPPLLDAHTFQIAQNKRKLHRDHKQHVIPTKHFYLLRGVLVCGHCGSVMGGRKHMKGHQQVYYCVQKERVWKTREEEHPKWKRGTGCSMVRSANIAKTDQTVWDIVKPVLLRLNGLPTGTSDEPGLDQTGFIEGDGCTANEIRYLSPDQIDQLSEEEKRALIQRLITKVSVFFDAETSRHRLDVEFTRAVSQALQRASVPQGTTDDVEERIEGASEDANRDGGCALEEDAGKKLWGSQINLAAYQNYSVTVE